MPMSFSLTQMVLVSAAYLLVLFGVAWISERGMIPRAIIRHPLTYTLSLGVYASAWAFYGTVGLAYEYGYGFLSSYLGVSGAFLLAPVLLYPILKITRTYQLSSLADLFAFRFRSSWAGALTTIFMLIGVLPLLALQIQAVGGGSLLACGRSSITKRPPGMPRRWISSSTAVLRRVAARLRRLLSSRAHATTVPGSPGWCRRAAGC